MVNCEFGGSFFFTLARRICELTSGAAELPGAARMLPCVRPAPERDHERDAPRRLAARRRSAARHHAMQQIAAEADGAVRRQGYQSWLR